MQNKLVYEFNKGIINLHLVVVTYKVLEKGSQKHGLLLQSKHLSFSLEFSVIAPVILPLCWTQKELGGLIW